MKKIILLIGIVMILLIGSCKDKPIDNTQLELQLDLDFYMMYTLERNESCYVNGNLLRIQFGRILPA